MPIRRPAPAPAQAVPGGPAPAVAPTPGPAAAAAPGNGLGTPNGHADPYPTLRPYRFHRAAGPVNGSHAVGDCPFCGADGKFSIDVVTGLWRCWVCGTGTDAGGGNALVFLRCLHERLVAACGMSFLEGVAADRRLLLWDTPARWGLCQAPDGAWVLPGYGPDGELDQLYRRTYLEDKPCLLPTPDVWSEGKAHAWHMAREGYDPKRPVVVVCEGPWDGMALWEVHRGEFGDSNIVAVPGCNVWRDEWTEACRGKVVVLLYDSDHPDRRLNQVVRPGWDGMRRVALRLLPVAAAVRVLYWGPDGYDPARPSGWDVRDALAEGGSSMAARQRCLAELVAKVGDVPQEWVADARATVVNSVYRVIESRSCGRWADCEEAWDMSRGGALRWRPDIADALAVILAVAASTPQSGNQLFLDLVGSPGSAKTVLCRGLLTSNHCIHVENISKILSGYKNPDDPKKDCSFLARANGKTWITCEFDTILTSPEYSQLMGKIRRIFDGETSSTYGNTDEDRVYSALRTPWIRAGTQKMMDHDQSQLGDRFLRFIMPDPPGAERREISRAALRSERAAIVNSATAAPSSIQDAATAHAHALTGGYVDWLRAHVEEEILKVNAAVTDEVEDACIDLAELSADLRARPIQEHQKKHTQDTHDFKELPTRLARQNVRLAQCLAVVLNKPTVDADVLRIVRKVALDTAVGNSLSVVQWLTAPNPKDPAGRAYDECGGLPIETLSAWFQQTVDRTTKYLMFLRKIDVLEWRAIGRVGAWGLTERVRELYARIMRR